MNNQCDYDKSYLARHYDRFSIDRNRSDMEQSVLGLALVAIMLLSLYAAF